MTKRQAVRLANQMAGLRPQILGSGGPKWDAFLVQYSEVVSDPKGELQEVRRNVR
jgi:hypothetical protein